MSRYSIKSIAVGFECPLIDFKDDNQNKELVDKLSSSYSDFFDIYKNDLELLELPNGNYLFLYTLVILVDNNCITRRLLEDELKKLEELISSSITEFLSNKEVKFSRKLD